MKNATFNKLISVAALAGGLAMTSGAHAGSAGELYSWSKAAGQNVSEAMSYPQLAVRRGEEGTASFKVTVDREGNVLDADLVDRHRSSLINGAAKRAVAKVDFPSLPNDYKSDTLTFSLNMNYTLAHSGKEYRQLREGRVSSQRIASNASPMSASIEILDDAE